MIKREEDSYINVNVKLRNGDILEEIVKETVINNLIYDFVNYDYQSETSNKKVVFGGSVFYLIDVYYINTPNHNIKKVDYNYKFETL